MQNALVGGGFGGKEDMTVQHLAALLTYVTKKPVKVKLTRAESLLVHPKRTEIIQLPDVAACIYRILFYRCAVAGFSQRRSD